MTRTPKTGAAEVSHPRRRVARGASPRVTGTPGFSTPPQEEPGTQSSLPRRNQQSPAAGTQTPPGAARRAADTAAPGGTKPAAAMTEAQLERQVRAILKDVAALVPVGDVLGYHTYFSKASHAGFPDWVFAGPRGVLFRELKTAKGRLSIAQVMWRRVLRQAGADVDTWRPDDLLSGRVARELTALAGLKVGTA